MVENYYELENFATVKPAKDNFESNEDLRAKQLLKNTTRELNGCYETGLLWKSDDVNMPDSYPMTFRRLETLQKKMNKDIEYAKGYEKAISEFIDSGYAKRLTQPQVECTSDKTWYLPHFGVVHPNKPGKIRIVFDAAAAVNGVSLNTQPLKGPDLNQPLTNVLSQFREGPIGVVADIKQMFLRVNMRPPGRQSQRFLWKEKDDVQVYEMQSMMFGTCSPTSAQFVKNINAEKYRQDYPDAVEAIVSNHYVDDFVKSFSDVATGIEVSKQVVGIHRKANFELRGFLSNSKDIMDALNDQKHDEKLITNMNVSHFDKTSPHKLSFLWPLESVK